MNALGALCTLLARRPWAPQTYVSERAVKDIHGTVVHVVLNVLDVVLHLHLDGVPIVVFATLELLVSILSAQPLLCAGEE